MSYNNRENPSELRCWRTCGSCFRCADKGEHPWCWKCSGRHDPKRKRDPYDIDDHCRCTEGVLQYRLQTGQMLQRRFESNPFRSRVTTDAESEDDRDWNRYVDEKREKYDDPTWDPIQFPDNSSVTDWMRRARYGG